MHVFDVALSQGAVAAIALYQKYLSPRKGFSCPHRLLYGGESCSSFVKRAVYEFGIRKAVPLARLRFADCKTASQQLRANREAFSSDAVLLALTPHVMSDDSTSQPHAKRRRNRFQRWWDKATNRCDCGCDSFPCGHGAFDACFDCGPTDSGCVDCTPCG